MTIDDDNEVKQLVENTKEHVSSAIQIVESEDRARGLYTLQLVPDSLLEYPKFSGCDTRCYFTFEGRISAASSPTKYPE